MDSRSTLGERGLEDRSRRRPEQGAGDRLRSPAAAPSRARAGAPPWSRCGPHRAL